MGFTRRQFLLTTTGSGIGFILPSFYEKALAFWQNHEEPLIQPAKDADTILYAWSGADLELNLGHPETEPSYDMTYRELIDNYYYGGLEQYLDESPYLEPQHKLDLDAKAKPDEILDAWLPAHSPNAKAYYLLKDLDLGPDLDGYAAVGGIHEIWGTPGSDYLAMAPNDYVSLSLLQERLNQLKTSIRIEVI